MNIGKKPSPFIVEDGNNAGQRFLVRGYPIKSDTYSDSYKFWFELDDNTILIKREGTDTLPRLENIEITQRWDAISGSCVLNLNGKEVSVYAASQVALEPLFF